MKKRLSKFFALMLAICMISVVVSGCSDSNSNSGASNAGSAAPAEKTKVTFWYLWSGDAIARIDELVKSYNAQSDKYEVEAVSTPDTQKILAAIAAQNGPDCSDDFSSNVAKYVGTGMLEPLDNYISSAGYDVDDIVPAALGTCKVEDITYALPCNINFSAMYYNKTILSEAGYTEPPKTLEEMYEMAVKTTKINSDGTIDTLGFPDFPSVYYADAIAVAAGGGFISSEGEVVSADNEGNKLMLQLAVDYRTKFGLENVQKFTSGGKYLDPTDPFLMGKQTFRIDGPWMGYSIKEEFKADVDYGVIYIPYSEKHPEYEGRARVSSSMLYVPASAKNKEGGFDFISYFCGPEGLNAVVIPGGDFPCRLSVIKDQTFLSNGYDRDFYGKLAESSNLITSYINTSTSEYETYNNEQIELCLNLKQSVEDTLANINAKGTEMFGK